MNIVRTEGTGIHPTSRDTRRRTLLSSPRSTLQVHTTMSHRSNSRSNSRTHSRSRNGNRNRSRNGASLTVILRSTPHLDPLRKAVAVMAPPNHPTTPSPNRKPHTRCIRGRIRKSALRPQPTRTPTRAGKGFKYRRPRQRTTRCHPSGPWTSTRVALGPACPRPLLLRNHRHHHRSTSRHPVDTMITVEDTFRPEGMEVLGRGGCTGVTLHPRIPVTPCTQTWTGEGWSTTTTRDTHMARRHVSWRVRGRRGRARRPGGSSSCTKDTTRMERWQDTRPGRRTWSWKCNARASSCMETT